MILLQQDSSSNFGNYGALLNKCGDTEISLNIGMLSEDIRKVQHMLSNSNNKGDIANLEKILKYLKKLRDRIDSNGKYQFTWMLEKWKSRVYPLELKHFNEFNIKATDYIEIGADSLVQINFKDVFEIIAFEMIYRDYGYDLPDIEKELADIGVVTISSADRILDIFKTEDMTPIQCSQIYKIGDSPYSTFNGKLSWDYFNTAASDGDAFSSGRYKECVERSINVGIDIIAKSIIEKFNDSNIQFKICAMNEDGLYFMMKPSDARKVQNIIDSVVVRAFGRKFEVKPKITIF